MHTMQQWCLASMVAQASSANFPSCGAPYSCPFRLSLHSQQLSPPWVCLANPPCFSRRCRNSTEDSHVPFTKLPLVIICYINIDHYQNQDTDIGIIQFPRLPTLSGFYQVLQALTLCVCVRAHVHVCFYEILSRV